MKLLLVEDEALLRDQLSLCLSRSGYAVTAVATAEEALDPVAQHHHDVALIDLGLPGMSGLELIRWLRASGQHLPILILSARSHWQDKVEGLNAGADDYLVKPFQFAELNGRLTVLLNRSRELTVPPLIVGPLMLDLNRKQALLDEQPLDLSAYEYRILEYLMCHQQQVMAKEQLMALHPDEAQRDQNVVEGLVYRLRRKLKGLTGFEPIDTVRGRGYRFAVRYA